MQKKNKTIILSKIRRYLRVLARRKYKWDYTPKMEKDITRVATKIYDLHEINIKKEIIGELEENNPFIFPHLDLD